MKLKWRLLELTNGVSRHQTKIDDLEAIIIDYHGESQSFVINAVGSLITSKDRLILFSEIDTKGLVNTKRLVLEYLTLFMNGVPLPPRLLASEKVSFSEQNLPKHRPKTKCPYRGYVVGAIYHTPDCSRYLRLLSIANVKVELEAVDLKMTLNFVDIISEEYVSLTVNEFNKIRLIRVSVL